MKRQTLEREREKKTTLFAFLPALIARPNVSVKAEMVQKGGVEFWVVSCISSGGRPDADIALALDSGEELQGENVTNSHMQTSSVLLPVTVYEGHNITCAFDHPKFTHHVTRVIALPSFCEY